jgi:hypothetical protein
MLIILYNLLRYFCTYIYINIYVNYLTDTLYYYLTASCILRYFVTLSASLTSLLRYFVRFAYFVTSLLCPLRLLRYFVTLSASLTSLLPFHITILTSLLRLLRLLRLLCLLCFNSLITHYYVPCISYSSESCREYPKWN